MEHIKNKDRRIVVVRTPESWAATAYIRSSKGWAVATLESRRDPKTPIKFTHFASEIPPGDMKLLVYNSTLPLILQRRLEMLFKQMRRIDEMHANK